MQNRLFYILLTLLVTCVACSKDSTSPVRGDVTIHNIICSASECVIPVGGEADILFSVEDAEAPFNFGVGSVDCQVAVRLSDKPSLSPDCFSLERVTRAVGIGCYRATLRDAGDGVPYKVDVTLVIKLQSGELVRSDVVTVRSSNFVGGVYDISLRRADNPSLKSDVRFSYDGSHHSYNAHIDDYIAQREFVLTIEGVEDETLSINGEPYDAKAKINLHSDATLSVQSEGNTTDYTLHLSCFTGLPVMSINTPGGVGVWSKEEWVEGSVMTLDGMGLFDDMTSVGLSIRGRGNSTWGYEKKPYNLKLDKKQAIMGMPKHKRWCLLANYMDRTLLRNRVAYRLAEYTSLAWTPRCEFVELILNGEHLGQYLLAEHIKVDENRVNITEMETTDNSGDAVTGGYLLELDFHYDNIWQWKGASGTPFAVKYPDEEDLTEQQFAWIKSHIAEVESVLYGSNFADKQNGYAKYIDPQSFVDYWLIYELCVNHELGNPGSVYLSKDRGGKLVAGPVWDFDWGTFSFKASPHAEWGLFIQWAWWYDRLFKDAAFKALARERWAVLKPCFEQIFAFIATESDYIRLSWHRNFSKWNISTNINGDETLAFDAAVERMTSVLQRRMDVIDNALR